MRLLSWVTAINVLVAAGFSVVGLFAPHTIRPAGAQVTDSTNIFAYYAAARAIPLAITALVIIIFPRSGTGLIVIGILAGVIQFVDAGIGFYQHDVWKTVGPLVIAALQFYAVFAFLKSQPSTPPN